MKEHPKFIKSPHSETKRITNFAKMVTSLTEFWVFFFLKTILLYKFLEH